jgi:hypothetical protein
MCGGVRTRTDRGRVRPWAAVAAFASLHYSGRLRPGRAPCGRGPRWGGREGPGSVALRRGNT